MDHDSLSLSPDHQRRIRAMGLDFLARFLEVETRRRPGNLDALAELGHVYTRQERYEEGLAIDRQLVRLVPDNPTVHYNLACSLALLERRDEAIESLERAVDLGYEDVEFLRSDEDLRALREEAGFRRLVQRIASRSETPS